MNESRSYLESIQFCVLNNFAHAGLSALKCVTQLDHLWQNHSAESGFHLCSGDFVVLNHEADVSKVLRILTAHHFC